MARLGDPKVVDILIGVALKDQDLFVRQSAAAVLAEFKDPKAIDALISASKDKDADVRKLAFQALSEFKDPKVTPGVPANAVTEPVDTRILRIALFPESTTKRLPEGSKASP